jgi:hypothetical protein
MAVDLDPRVVQAIQRFIGTKRGRRYDRYARKRYGLPGAILLGKTSAGEAGGRSNKSGAVRNAVSSAGARGSMQFIPSTRDAYKAKYGVDAWGSDFDAISAAALHHLSTGVEGYNPGMPTYLSYIKGQKLNKQDRRALKGLTPGAGGGKGGKGTGGTVIGGRKINFAGKTSTDWEGALLAALTAGPQGRQGKSLLGYTMELGDSGAFTRTSPGSTITTPKYRVGGGVGKPGKGKGAPAPGMTVRKDGWHGAKSVGLSFADLAKKNGLQSVSEKRGTVSTASGGVSDHYQGNRDSYAWDLSNGSAPTPQMDKTARQIAAMLGVKNWKGGVLNVNKKIDGRTYRFQLLYRTNVGGNHYNHIHLGIDRIDTAG